MKHSNVTDVVEVPLANSSEKLQNTVATVADFKANNSGESPVQADLKRGDKIANGIVAVGSAAISLIPMAKSAQYGVAALGAAFGISGTIERSPAYHTKYYGTVTK